MPTRRPTSPQATVAKRLYEIAAQLHAGQSFNSTRLTLLKRACADPKIASAFALHMARLTLRKATQKRSSYIREARWREYLPLMKRVIAAMRRVAESSSIENRLALGAAVANLARMQDTLVPVPWAMAREIEYNEAYIVELAGECVLNPDHADRWAYGLARAYAERYDSRYSVGLTPKSAPLVQDIAAFWARLKPSEGET